MIKGYFGIGVEGVSKSMNVGSLMRTAHAFHASFFFTIAEAVDKKEMRLADTTDAAGSLPYHRFSALEEFRLPERCSLVGVELTDDAVDLPSFRHPRQAAYVLGPERGSLSARLTERCDHVIKIPTRFCINLAVAGAVVMYDRMISLGRFADRPLMEGGDPIPLEKPLFGKPTFRSQGRRVKPPIAE